MMPKTTSPHEIIKMCLMLLVLLLGWVHHHVMMIREAVLVEAQG